MANVIFDISMSLDGFVAGPDATLEEPLGKGGEQLHEWVLATEDWRKAHGLEGGEQNADSEVMAETIARSGATIMGRKMYSGGSGPWEDDPNPDGWWGDEPPFRHPVFVLTHHPRETGGEGRRHDIHVRDGRHRVGAGAGAGRGRRQGRHRRRRRRRSPAVPRGRPRSTSSRCTSPRSSSAAASGSSTTSRRRGRVRARSRAALPRGLAPRIQGHSRLRPVEPEAGPTGPRSESYAAGTTVVLTSFDERVPKTDEPLLSAPPAARIAKPSPESRRAMPTTIPKSDSDSAM